MGGRDPKRVVYAGTGPRTHKTITEAVLRRCVIALRGSLRARPSQREEFLFEGPYHIGATAHARKYGAVAHSEFVITFTGERGRRDVPAKESRFGRPSWSGLQPRARFKINEDLSYEIEADPTFSKKALRCLDSTFNALTRL